MKTHIIQFVIAVLLECFLPLTGWGAPRDAVVKIESVAPDGSKYTGSGVCVSPDGIVLTVRHVVVRKQSTVLFGQTRYSVERSAVPDKEGVAILKVSAGKPLPFLEIANTAPQVGENVWVMGYPAGGWKTFGTTVTSTTLRFADDPQTRLVGVFAPVRPGTSGGPLLTASGKVAGIASVSGKLRPREVQNMRPQDRVYIQGDDPGDTGGMFLQLHHVKAAYEAFTAQKRGPPQKPVLYALVTDSCSVCQQFKQDVSAGKFAKYEVRYVRFGEKWYGPQDVVPQFYTQGMNSPQRGYSSAPGLLQILARIVAGLGKAIYNPAAEQQQEYPRILPDEPPGFSDPPEPPTEQPPVPKELDPDLQKIRDDLMGALEDIRTLKDGSAFQKLPALLSLKGEIENLKQDKELVSGKVDQAKAELETVITVVKQDAAGLKATVDTIKDSDAGKLEKIQAIGEAVIEAKHQAKAAKDLVGGEDSALMWLIGALAGLLGTLKGWKEGE